MKKSKSVKRDLAEEVDLLDTMLTSLVELLEEKGVVTQEEWEKRIATKTLRATGVKKYRDVQFSSKP